MGEGGMNEPIFPGPTEAFKSDLEDLSERLDATQRNLEYTARKLNQLEEDIKEQLKEHRRGIEKIEKAFLDSKS